MTMRKNDNHSLAVTLSSALSMGEGSAEVEAVGKKERSDILCTPEEFSIGIPNSSSPVRE